MATNSTWGQPLAGLDAELAARPFTDSVTGGVNELTGSHVQQGEPTEPMDPMAGMGPFLEDDPRDVFRAVHQLVLRQEPLAKNRLAIDTYWTHVKRGYGGWYRLEKIPDQDRYKCAIAPGASAISRPAAPNKAYDLCQKIVAALLVDLPAPEPEAETDDETAQRAAELAERFLAQDGGEQGTRDGQLFERALLSATHRASAYTHYWVDPTGNGSVPLQIKAHPQAVDPSNPLVGPNGESTTEYVLRYVTPAGEDGQGAQFTTDPSQADRQWLPKLRADIRFREHVRCYPETAAVDDAEMIIVLDHTTVGEGRRRWPETMGQMPDDQIGALCDWTPVRHLHLLPPSLRSRWKNANGDVSDPKGSSKDERTLFFYAVYRRPTPDYPRGCALMINGANGGTVLDKATLSAELQLEEGRTDIRMLDVPLVQWTLVPDDEDQDPTGKPLIAEVGPSALASEGLITSIAENADRSLNRASFIPVTSPVTGDDVANSRATGDMIPVLSSNDYPHYEESPPTPGEVFSLLQMLDEQQNLMANTSKPMQGADNQQEVSGVAREIAVAQANVGLSPKLQAFLASVERHWRIKLERAQASFKASQLIRYTGEDGEYQQAYFTGQDFSRVTGVKVKAGTGTMIPPSQKPDFVQKIQSMGYLQPEVATEIAQSAFTKMLGVPPDPQRQRVERQIAAWEKGPPSPEWVQQAQAYNQAKAQADQINQQNQQAYQQHVQQIQNQHAALSADHQTSVKQGVPAASPTPPTLPPPPQPVPPTDPQTQQPMSPPWTPFGPLPMDDEPLIAGVRQARLRDVMASTKFASMPPEWQQVLADEYNRMRTAVAASQAPAPLPKGVTIGVKAGPNDVQQAEQAATSKPQQQAA